eukprot:TRINITY_DN1793_c0_g3_i1.p1 TRINITY_DN1793_c0_g3~~TRINITY_DN1793_c0_g3_i1.p1  ORF type:complete len:334 (+),score=103.47 TRINITY_DN1793_c0_g3_i1:96-1004(+)
MPAMQVGIKDMMGRTHKVGVDPQVSVEDIAKDIATNFDMSMLQLRIRGRKLRDQAEDDGAPPPKRRKRRSSSGSRPEQLPQESSPESATNPAQVQQSSERKLTLHETKELAKRWAPDCVQPLEELQKQVLRLRVRIEAAEVSSEQLKEMADNSRPGSTAHARAAKKHQTAQLKVKQLVKQRQQCMAFLKNYMQATLAHARKAQATAEAARAHEQAQQTLAGRIWDLAKAQAEAVRGYFSPPPTPRNTGGTPQDDPAVQEAGAPAPAAATASGGKRKRRKRRSSGSSSRPSTASSAPTMPLAE